MVLSKRLDTIVNMIAPCSILADIGCDHGYVSISAIKRNLAKHVISADIAEGPLDAARRNASAEGTLKHMDFMISDGLVAFADDCGLETVVIAGMGGILIRKILEQGHLQRFDQLKQLVLGPQSDIDQVRHYLIDTLKMSIVSEKCIFDDGKYYFLLDVRNYSSDEVYSEDEYRLGRNIDPATLDTYRDYLQNRLRQMRFAFESASKGNPEHNAQKIAGIQDSIKYIETALIKAGGSR